MKTYLDCVPCFLKQALNAARMASPDESVHKEVIKFTLKTLETLDYTLTPPYIAQIVHREIRRVVGDDDPYKQVKLIYNEFALGLLPQMREKIESSDDPFATATQLAIIGNIIDFGAKSDITEETALEEITRDLHQPLIGGTSTLRKKIDEAEKILYLADNAGEIAFDRLLIELMPTDKVTLVVKGSPVINDATLEDAEMVGLTQLVNVIDNGSDAPGTILADCSNDFLDYYNRADLIIAKGQGNYESLNDQPGNISFLLKAKCPVIARDIDCDVGDLILINGGV